jgi:N-acetylglucosamine-6-phosphate deacetylase
MQLISAPAVLADGQLRRPGVVAVEAGRVAEVLVGPAAVAARSRADIVLAAGMLVPGFVDVQVNGYFGVDFIAAEPEDWAAVAVRLPETGVTGFVPTFITAPVEVLRDGLRRAEKAIAALAASGVVAARPLGVHVEGPFLAERWRGAHNADWLRDPDPATVGALLGAAAPGAIAILTLAPERAGGLAAVRRLAAAGIVVSVGHSDASAEQVAAAADAGARMVTHLFNAQRPLHHRDPGVVGQALIDPRLTCGLILDLHHVAAGAARLAFTAAPGRVALVTDAVAAAGMPPGRYVLGGEPVFVEHGRPPLREAGVIAGSGLRLDAAISNAVGVGVDLVAAVEAASRVPADLLGHAELGRIAPGARADLVWLGEDLAVRATWVGGVLAHGAAEVRTWR